MGKILFDTYSMMLQLLQLKIKKSDWTKNLNVMYINIPTHNMFIVTEWYTGGEREVSN